MANRSAKLGTNEDSSVVIVICCYSDIFPDTNINVSGTFYIVDQAILYRGCSVILLYYLTIYIEASGFGHASGLGGLQTGQLF